MLSQVSEDSVYYLCMPDTLPKLLQEIHSVRTPSELNTRFPDFQSRIATILFEHPSEENYYVNHTGRELFRKLYNYGLDHLITDSYDSGFRPILDSGIQTFTVTVNGVNGTETGGGEILIGSTINITATPNDLYQFDSWTVVGPGQIGSTTSANTTFTVGAGDVTITANYSIVAAPLLTGSFTDPNVLLTASVVNGTATYQFQRSTSSDFSSDLTTIQNTSSNTCSDSLNSTGIYYYRVRSVSGSTQTSWSNTESFNISLADVSSITSTIGWYDTSDSSTLTITNSIVEQIDDKSGNSIDLIAASLSIKNHTLVTSGLNGLNTVSLDGDDRYNPAAGDNVSIPNGNLQAFVLTQVDEVDSANDSIISMAGGTTNFQLMAADSTAFKALVNSQAGVTSASSTNFVGSYHIFNAFFDWGNTVIRSYVDGKVEGSATYSSQLSSPLALRIYTNRGNSSMPAGKIAEIILCHDVSDTVREKIEGYLAHKWGLESNLPTNHTYKSQAPLKSS